MAKHSGGRPTKFKPEFTTRLVEFFDIEPFYKEVCETSKEYFADGRLKKESEKFRYIANKMPTLYRFSKSIGVDYTTVWRWAEKGEWDGETEPDEKFEQFCNAYKEAKELQKEFLVSLGLGGVAPPASFIFTAKNVTDMSDKVITDITTKGEKLNQKSDGLFMEFVRTRLGGRRHSEVGAGEQDQDGAGD